MTLERLGLFLIDMNRLAGMFQIDFKRYILIIIGAILFNVLIAQPLKLTLELKGAVSTGDSFLLYEPIYAILTAKNVSKKNQKILNFQIYQLGAIRGKEWELQPLVYKDGGETLSYTNVSYLDDFGLKKYYS